MCLAAMACSGDGGPDERTGMKVGLVVDGQLDDNTYNRRVLDGCLDASTEFGLGFDNAIAENGDYLAELNAFAEAGYQHIVSVSFLSAEATMQAAMAHPDVNFAILDYNYETYPPNLQGYSFREDEGGFLAGTLAAAKSKEGAKKVACLGGIEIPAIKRFCNGFERGAKRSCPDCEVFITYTSSFADVAEGEAAAHELMRLGADVIFGAAGLTGSAGIKYAAQQGAWVIGVDNDEFFQTFLAGVAPGADRLLSSVIKRADLAAYRSIEASVMGTFEPGSIVLGLADGALSMAEFHMAEAHVGAGIRNELDAAYKGLADGSLTTGVDPATGDLLP
jgi:basic membrane lipoprotein Med (substrate-binding protein (PBP1-ABC) superfamily)